MQNPRTVEAVERGRESLTLTKTVRVYLAYAKITFRKINKEYLKIEML